MEKLLTFLGPVIPALAFVVFTVSEAFSDAYQLRDFRGLANGGLLLKKLRDDKSRWHFWQAIRQGALIAVCSWLYQSPASLLLFASIFWLAHDGIVNRVGLDRSFWYVGTTAWIDRLFQRFPNPPLAMAAAKIGFILLGSFLTFILWKTN